MMKKSLCGFTMIEILVVITILGIMGLVVTDIFIRSLRGNEKARVLGSIKQNGQAVLERLDKTIRGADNLVCVTPAGDTLVVSQKDGYTRYRFKLNAILQDRPSIQSGETTEQFLSVSGICNLNNERPESPALFLTDTSPTSGVIVENGKFTRVPLAGYKDGVNIDFGIKPAATSAVFQIDPVEFKTSVTLR